MAKIMDKLQVTQLYAWNYLTGFISAATGDMTRILILSNTTYLYEFFL